MLTTADPSMLVPSVQLVRDADPTGARTRIVVTKADQIPEPTESSWGDLVLGRNSNFTLRPAMGVYPARLRLPGEFRSNTSFEDIVAVNETLFDTEQWKEIAKSVGHELGLGPLAAAVYSGYEQLVAAT